MSFISYEVVSNVVYNERFWNIPLYVRTGGININSGVSQSQTNDDDYSVR